MFHSFLLAGQDFEESGLLQRAQFWTGPAKQFFLRMTEIERKVSFCSKSEVNTRRLSIYLLLRVISSFSKRFESCLVQIYHLYKDYSWQLLSLETGCLQIFGLKMYRVSKLTNRQQHPQMKVN